MRPFVLVLFALSLVAVGTAFAGDPVVGVDAHGDPLPAGAVARLGTVRFRGVLGPSPVPNTLATLRDNRLALIHPETGAIAQHFPGPDPRDFEADSFATSDDGRYVGYIGSTGTEIWDVSAARRLFVIPPEQRRDDFPMPFFAMPMMQRRPLFLLNNPALALVGGNDIMQTVTAWDMERGKILWKLPAGNDRVSDDYRVIGVLPDIFLVVVFHTLDGKILLVEARTGKIAREIKLGASFRHSAVALSPTTCEIAATDDKDKIRRFELLTGKELKRLDPGVEHLRMLAFGQFGGLTYSPDGAKLLLRHMNEMKLFDLPAQSVKSIKRDEMAGYSFDQTAVFNSDSSRLWIADHQAPAWKEYDVKLSRSYSTWKEGHRGWLTGLAIAPKTNVIATTANAESVQIWDGNTGKRRAEIVVKSYLPFSMTGLRSPIALSPDGATLATRDFRHVQIWRVADQKERRTIRTSGDGFGYGSALAFQSDCKTLAISPGIEINIGNPPTSKQFMRLFDTSSGKEVKELFEDSEPIASVAFSANDRWLLVMTSSAMNNEPKATVYDANTGRLERLRGGARAAAFLPVGDVIAYANDTAIEMDELFSGQTRLRIPAPRGCTIQTLAVSPDGHWLAAAGNGQRTRPVYLWDLHTGAPLTTLMGHNDGVLDLAFGSGGKLVSSSMDTTALVWDATRFTRPVVPAARDLAATWQALGAEAGAAHRAMESLLSLGPKTIAFFRERLKPLAVPNAAAVADCVKRLDSKVFSVRRAAGIELEQFDLQAAPALREHSTAGESPEARHRALAMLNKLSGVLVDPDRLRELRAVEVLQRLGSPEAKILLAELARGDPAARLTMAAERALAGWTQH